MCGGLNRLRHHGDEKKRVIAGEEREVDQGGVLHMVSTCTEISRDAYMDGGKGAGGVGLERGGEGM